MILDLGHFTFSSVFFLYGYKLYLLMCEAVDLRSIFVSSNAPYINQFSFMCRAVDLWRVDVGTVDVMSV
jgi:hypothetical protein